ncbi:MAG: isoprenyl transferase [Thermodesulfobacteriota bacterium]|nr:isoprenyl transferase [Thermodesulfobacteriota bacterium]
MTKIDLKRLPVHIAIIMDGNGRWAKKRNLARIFGHQKGILTVRRIIKNCRKLGIKILTLYAFSQENWKRPNHEVTLLMDLLKEYLLTEMPELIKNNIRLHAIGDLKNLPKEVYQILIHTIQKTKDQDKMLLNLALSYGGRDEIIKAVRKISIDYKNKGHSPEEITEKVFSEYLTTRGIPDPDLLIRTSGEMRLSNFLLWQMAYTEIYVTKVLWPDFKKRDLDRALISYQKRERRFGLTSEQVKKGLTI